LKQTDISRISAVMYVSDNFLDGKLQLPDYYHNLLLIQ